MQIRDNVRERRRERIQQIIGQQSREDLVKSPYNSADASKRGGSTEEFPRMVHNKVEEPKLETEFIDVLDLENVGDLGAIHSNLPPITRMPTPPPRAAMEDPDPELWWKEREKRVKESRGSWQGLKGIPTTTQAPMAQPARIFDFNKFIIGFTWRWVCAALVFAAAWGWFKLELPGSKEAHTWMVSSVTRDMDFEAIEAWYGDTFGGSPSFFPFNQDKNETKEVSARLTPQETTVPVAGTVIESFAQSKSGVKVAALSGSEVVAIFTGRVMQVTQDQNGGITIRVQHANNLSTVYGNIGNAVVKPNDWVETGQALGQLEGTEDSESGILFFAVQENGETLDPADVVTFD